MVIRRHFGNTFHRHNKQITLSVAIHFFCGFQTVSIKPSFLPWDLSTIGYQHAYFK